tara:strand:- start:82 stop:276 length:195 start_codon:yes stop_codon:yes gene_type:complete
MANTYTWKVGQCDRTLETGVITTLHYTVTAVTKAQAVSWVQVADTISVVAGTAQSATSIKVQYS